MDRSLQLFLLNLLSLKKSMLDAIQSHGPIHGTRIDIQVMDPVGQDLGDTALARSGRPINGNRQFSHGMHSFVAAAVPATKPVEKAACRL